MMIYILLICFIFVEKGFSFIIESPSSLQVKKGSSALFRCRSSAPQAHISWTHNGHPISNQRGSRDRDDSYESRKVLEDGTLVIQNIVKSSEGVYLCTASTQDGRTVSRPAELTVLERTEKPRITHRPAETTVKLGDLIVLDCLASGYPPPTYTWYKDGGRLSAAHQRFNQMTNGSLVIDNAQYDDAAHYRCSASNYLGKASSSTKIKVESSEPVAPPRITTRPRSRRLQKGGIVELTCVARGNPYPVITWWNNKRLVTGTARIKLSNGGQHLRIQDVEVYDSGWYTCVAQNSEGKEQVSASIQVLSDNHNSVGEDPISSFSIQALEVKAGSVIMLECPLQQDDEINWSLNGLILSTSNNPRMFQNSDGVLKIYNAEKSDSGEYTCSTPSNRINTKVYRVTVTGDQHSTVTGDQHSTVTGDQHSTVTGDQHSTVTGDQHSTVTGDQHSTVTGDQHSHQRDEVDNLVPGEQQRSGGIESGLLETRGNLVESFHSLGPEFSRNQIQNDEESRYDSDLSYDIRAAQAREQIILTSIEEARRTVDKALNYTVQLLFAHQQHTRRTPHQLLRIFRYPSGSERELARAGEIYQRTLELVESKVKEGSVYNLTTFSLESLISPANLELIGNLSGCEAHRQEYNCEDVCFHRKYRSADSTCNNWVNAAWGASLAPFRRILPPQYENGFNTPIGFDPERLYHGYRKPNPRKISSLLLSSDQVSDDPTGTIMLMQWGQFLDHDLGHSMESVARQTFRTGETCSGSCANEPPCFSIPIPPGDPRIGANECIEFTRSAASCGSGSTSVFFERLQPREQVNQLSSFIDASQVYGSERTLALNLRNLTNDFGRLREGLTYEHGKPLLPFNDGHPIDCRRDLRESDIGCFLAGDVRANEQLGLLAMHTLFFREHNRLADQLRSLNPHWEGETIYQEAKKILGAVLQHISFKHWLPHIIGDSGMEMLNDYQGYNGSVDSTLSNVFTTAAFRFGHTMIPPTLFRLDTNLQPIQEGNLKLHEAFFAPWRIVQEGGIDPILRGLYSKPAKMASQDAAMTGDLTEKLFQAAHVVALDLAALNIQRGRDHALPSYPEWAQFCNLDPINTWQDLYKYIQNAEIIRKLRDLYGDVRNIDLWVAGVLEKLVPGGRVGPIFQCLIVEQMKRLRDGDRFWYERQGIFTEDQKDQLKEISLARILCDNGDDIRKIKKNIFLNSESEISCSHIPKMSLLPWKECFEEISGSSFSSDSLRRASSALHNG